jgi:superfamily II DNA/RNA helicase
LRDEEEHHGLVCRIKRPRAIIILPMRELAIQVLAVAKSLCHHVRFRVVGLFGGHKERLMRESLETPCDIIIATPDTLKRHQSRGKIYLTDVSHIVVDEVDTMWHSDFRPTVLHLLSLLNIQEEKPPFPRSINRGTQVILVGAMLPSSVEKQIEETIPKVKKAKSKNLHKLMAHVEHQFLRVRPEDKAEKLLSLLKCKPENKVVIFCNTIPSCDWVANYLAENGVFPIKLHGSVSSLERTERFKLYQQGRTNVLVCTDVVSRGVNTNFVNQIILFDFPTTAADYIHRSGRTGRVGGPHNCVVTSLVCRKREYALVHALKDAWEKNEAILSMDTSQSK